MVVEHEMVEEVVLVHSIAVLFPPNLHLYQHLLVTVVLVLHRVLTMRLDQQVVVVVLDQ